MVREHPLTSRVFFFNDTATTEIYTLSLHDALPISAVPVFSTTDSPCSIMLRRTIRWVRARQNTLSSLSSHRFLMTIWRSTLSISCFVTTLRHVSVPIPATVCSGRPRSEEHTSELQSRQY